MTYDDWKLDNGPYDLNESDETEDNDEHPEQQYCGACGEILEDCICEIIERTDDE